MGKTSVITGCAGFIGSNLVDRLVDEGRFVIGVDNFSTGQRRSLEGALEGGLRRADLRLLRRARFRGLHITLRVDPWGEMHSRTHIRFL
jgi:nucleoside-diphosphate-sugar epimerase